MLKIRGNEQDWIEQTPNDSLVYRCFDRPARWWSKGPLGLVMEEHGNYVHIKNPNVRCLSMLGKIVAILPKNRLRVIYNLIGEYLNAQELDT